MKHITKKMAAWSLIFALLLGIMPKEVVKAAATGSIYYAPRGQQGCYTECLDDALQSCSVRGGTIVLGRDIFYDYPDFIHYDVINKDTILVVDEGVKLTIGKKGLKVDGILQIRGGTVDLQNSEGILYGDGQVQMLAGQMIKKTYSPNKNNSDICLEARGISYGQKLKEAEIVEDKVMWSMPIPGTWKFVKEDLVPQSGVLNQDVVFEPEYPMTYDSMTFSKGGKVTVYSVTPRREDNTVVSIYAGQNLTKIHPELTYVSPVTGKKVPGEFTFYEDAKNYEVGRHEMRGVFNPKDDNYESVEDDVIVNITSVKPEEIEPPVVRNQGAYGEKLNQIRFLEGKYRNPKTGEAVSGRFEWKDGEQSLRLGNCSYTMLFIPDVKGYETVESEIYVTTLPKVMGEFEWPSCSNLTYGEKLADSTLSFEKNDYGIFFWEDEKVCPSVKNAGVRVVFRPADTVRYDWSKVAGYDEQTHTITCSIPITVRPIKGTLPSVKAAVWKEGEAVSGCALTLVSGSKGVVAWQNPEQKADKSGMYQILFTPKDTDNYDWSSYEQDANGNIYMQVSLVVQPKPTPIPTATPLVTPTVIPTQTPIPTPVPSSSGAPILANSEKNILKQNNAAVSAQKPMTTFVITQMVSKTSKIKSPIISQTEFLKVKKSGKRVRLLWKKKKEKWYQIQWSTSSKFKNPHKKKIRKNLYVIKKGRRKKIYYVRVRCLKKVNGSLYYGKWSRLKKI